MNEIQDVKEVLTPSQFEDRAIADRKRLFAFLLCTDEHRAFRQFIQDAWRTLNALSGSSCDIFTLEKWEAPPDKLSNPNYLHVSGGTYGRARLAPGDNYGFPGQQVAIDNGIYFPDRAECLKVRNRLFAKPASIILPGVAISKSPYEKVAIFYTCSRLDSTQTSELFQVVLTGLGRAYEAGKDRDDVYERFSTNEAFRRVKRHVSEAFLKLSLNDLFAAIGYAFRLVSPSSGRKHDT